jgi:lipase chaperone LimK
VYKKLAALFGITLVAVIAVHLYLRSMKDESGYIFDNSAGIRLADITQSRKAIHFASSKDMAGGAAQDLTPGMQTVVVDQQFTKKDGHGVIVDSYTLKYFKHLQTLFKSSKDLAHHLEEVRAYLFSLFGKKEAQELFDIYKKYIQCEMDLAKEQQSWGAPKTIEGVIAMLRRAQEFRRSRLGDELADELFGAQVKAQEYAARRGAIVADKGLSGAEKEERLRELNLDMWGDEADAVEEHPKPYDRYREKLRIYEQDLAAMGSDEERKAKIKEFRETYFEPEVVGRLEEVDRQIEAEAQTEKTYRSDEEKILSDKKLSDEEKKKAVEDLQNKTFGQEAEAFRRREAIRIDLERRQSGQVTAPKE